MLSHNSSYQEIKEPRQITYRLPIIIAALLMSLVLALTVSSKSTSSFPRALSRKERITNANETNSQEGLKQFLPHDDCPRLRRDWHDLTQEERNLFLDGFWEMYKLGYVKKFFDCHTDGGVHLVPNFFPWHRIFTYEFETRIRALGGRFRCFAMPYWDWTRMAGKPVAANPLWKQGFGGDGVLSPRDLEFLNRTGSHRLHGPLSISGGCVLDGRFNKSSGYKTKGGDCLRRRFRPGDYWYSSTEQSLYVAEKTQIYTDFQTQFEAWHSPVHNAIGGRLTSEEPLFFLIHSYVDLIWSLRSDCHGYDEMTNWQTNEEIYVPSLLNTALNFPHIANLPWSIANKVQLTPANVLNFPQFGIQYDFSNMFERTKMQMRSCHFTYFHPKFVELPAGSVRVPDAALAKSACEKAFAGCKKIDVKEMGNSKQCVC